VLQLQADFVTDGGRRRMLDFLNSIAILRVAVVRSKSCTTIDNRPLAHDRLTGWLNAELREFRLAVPVGANKNAN